MDIAYICIFAGKFEESAAFYQNIIGLELDASRSTANFCALRAGSTFIGIEKDGFRKAGEKSKSENPVLIQFKAASLIDLKSFTEKLEKQGVRVLNRLVETHYGTYTNFLDPDGNRLEILFQN